MADKGSAWSIYVYKFLTQVTFSASVMLLCIWMLATGKAVDEEREALYWSGLNGTLAYWLPNPQLPPDSSTASAPKKRKRRVKRKPPSDS